MTIAYISHPDCLLHDMGPEHPECPARLHAIQDHLVARGIELVLRHYDAPLATEEQLCRVHDRAYLERLSAESPTEGLHWIDGETGMCPGTLRAAYRAAGAAVHGVDLVMRGEATSAFCAVRPPGHHAGRSRAGGFCFFNNVAVGAAHALAEHGLERVAICDFDAHHGDGIEEIFRDDPRVLYCSSFEHPAYPYAGADTGGEHLVNVPLKAGTDGRAFRRAVADAWFDRMAAFAPQMVLVSAGFDGHAEDDMTRLVLGDDDFRWVSCEIKRVADASAGGRVVSVLEGGYSLSALGRGGAAHIDALLGNKHGAHP